MALNQKYIAINDLQQYFVDKTTGLPLAGGKVYFFEDEARTIPKPVFKLSGSPPNYTYTEIVSNPLILSSVGTFCDETSTDITVYAYPYSNSDELQLYFVDVYNANDEFQFSREAFPSGAASGTGAIKGATNFVPNGQFLLHNDLQNEGVVSSGITHIAPGGWTFERDDTSIASDTIKFTRFNSYVDNPSDSPRYSCTVACITPDIGNTFKSLRIKFSDVNKFASAENYFTIAFQARSNLVGSLEAGISIIKSFGTGGDVNEIITVGEAVISGSYQWFSLPVIFGDNTGKSIGLLNDDYVQISIDLPPDTIFDISITNFGLYEGELDITDFPSITNSQFQYRSLPMPIPAYDGSSIGLPIVWNGKDFEFDDSIVGTGGFSWGEEIPKYSLHCDGSSYSYSGISSDGIPYSRLASKLWDPTNGRYIYGCGSGWFEGYSQSNNVIRIHNTTSGVSSNFTDGSVQTGFTFNQVNQGFTDLNDQSFYFLGSSLFVITSKPGISATKVDFDPGTSGFSYAILSSNETVGNATSQETYRVTATSSSGLSGKYFTYKNSLLSNRYVWFTVDGIGTDPAPGGTGTLVKLIGTDTSTIVSQKIVETMNGWTTYSITVGAGNTISPGSYFNIYTPNSNRYIIWFKVDGLGSAPILTASDFIEINISSSYASVDVVNAIKLAINVKNFSVPKGSGQFPRFLDTTGFIDRTDRISKTTGVTGNRLGTTQLDYFGAHNHSYYSTYASGVILRTTINITDSSHYEEDHVVKSSGFYETVPKNIVVKPFIYY